MKNKKKKNNKKKTITVLIIAISSEIIAGAITNCFPFLSIFTDPLKNFFLEIFSASILFNFFILVILIILIVILMFPFYKIILKREKYQSVNITYIVFLFLLIISTIALGYHTQTLHNISNKIVIIVTEFDDEEASKKTRFNKDIYEILKEKSSCEASNMFLVEKSSKVINNYEEAKKEGNKVKAETVIVIWGAYDDFNINTNFTVARTQGNEICTRNKKHACSVEMDYMMEELKNFSTYTYIKNLPETMSCLTDFYIGSIYYLNSDYDNAILKYNLVIENLPEQFKKEHGEIQSRILTFLGSALNRSKHFKEAKNELEKAIEIDPNNIIAHNNLGVSLIELDNYGEAKNMIEKAIDKTDGEANALIYHNMGRALLELENYGEAEKKIRKSIELYPDNAIAHDNLGILLVMLKRYTEAGNEFREALRIDPNNAGARDNLKSLSAILEIFEEKKKELKEASETDPNNIHLHNNLGILLTEMEHYKEAEEEFGEALRIDPDNITAHNNLSYLLAKLKRYGDAENELEKAIKIDPNNTIIQSNLDFLIKIQRKDTKKEWE